MTDCNCDELYVGNTTNVELYGVEVEGVANDDAVVTVTVKNSAGAVVSGGDAVPMPNVSSGTYRGALPSTLAIVVDGRYTLEITATIADVGIGLWTISRPAKLRGRT